MTINLKNETYFYEITLYYFIEMSLIDIQNVKWV